MIGLDCSSEGKINKSLIDYETCSTATSFDARVLNHSVEWTVNGRDHWQLWFFDKAISIIVPLCNERYAFKFLKSKKKSQECCWFLFVIHSIKVFSVKKKDLMLFLWLLWGIFLVFSYNQSASLLIELRKVWSLAGHLPSSTVWYAGKQA